MNFRQAILKYGINTTTYTLLINVTNKNTIGTINMKTPKVQYTDVNKQLLVESSCTGKAFYKQFGMIFSDIGLDVTQLNDVKKMLCRGKEFFYPGEITDKDFTLLDIIDNYHIYRYVPVDIVNKEYEQLSDELKEKYGEKDLKDCLALVPLSIWSDQDLILSMYKIVVDILNKNNIIHFIYGGAALGMERDNDLIFWDADIDIGALNYLGKLPKATFEEKIIEMFKDNKDITPKFEARPYGCGNFVRLNFNGTYKNEHIEIKFFAENDFGVVFDALNLPGFKKEWLVPARKVEHRGVTLYLPNKPQEYLLYDYGTNWKERIYGILGDWEHNTKDCWKWNGERRF